MKEGYKTFEKCNTKPNTYNQTYLCSFFWLQTINLEVSSSCKETFKNSSFFTPVVKFVNHVKIKATARLELGMSPLIQTLFYGLLEMISLRNIISYFG